MRQPRLSRKRHSSLGSQVSLVQSKDPSDLCFLGAGCMPFIVCGTVLLSHFTSFRCAASSFLTSSSPVLLLRLPCSGKELTEKVAVVKANIRMVLEGLRELQQLGPLDGGKDDSSSFFDPRGGL